VVQHKPGALRNGAPLAELPEAFITLQQHLLKKPGGDREMVDILALVLQHDEDAVLLAVEMALETGVPTKTHVLNLLHRLVDGKSLKMHGMAQAVGELTEQGSPAFEASIPILSQLLKAETAEREVRSTAYQPKTARFPAYRDLNGFDFSSSEGNEPLVRQLHRCDFLDQANNIVLVGGPGTGKTHIATAIGAQAIEHYQEAGPGLFDRLVGQCARIGKGPGALSRCGEMCLISVQIPLIK